MLVMVKMNLLEETKVSNIFRPFPKGGLYSFVQVPLLVLVLVLVLQHIFGTTLTLHLFTAMISDMKVAQCLDMLRNIKVSCTMSR